MDDPAWRDRAAMHAPEPPKETFSSIVNEVACVHPQLTIVERNARAYAIWAYKFADELIKESKNPTKVEAKKVTKQTQAKE